MYASRVAWWTPLRRRSVARPDVEPARRAELLADDAELGAGARQEDLHQPGLVAGLLTPSAGLVRRDWRIAARVDWP